MNIYITYGIIFVVLLALELCYFKIADKCNIIDKPNERSSHSTIVLRGGGIIFILSIFTWTGLQMVVGNDLEVMNHLPFLIGLFLIAGVSFIDDIRSLPDSIRLVVQFVSYGLMFYNLDFLQWSMWWVVILALIISVGATNIINFMDGINGMTAGYSLAVLIPLALLNSQLAIQNSQFVTTSLLITVILGILVFSAFNFRSRGKAKCFAGDVGSIGIAFIMLFVIGKLVIQTQDITYLIFLLVYGVDGCLTICHRIMLHEELGEAHRKHAYQLMANELKMGHMKVVYLYMTLQLAISLGFIYVCPNTVFAHWMYLSICVCVLCVAYIVFQKKFYHLHEEYLMSLKK